MQSDNEIRYVSAPSRVTTSVPWIVALAVAIVALLLLLAMGFQQSPMMSAAFVIVLLVGMLGWVLDSRSRGRAHSEQLSSVHETVAQAVAPAVAQSVMQILGGIVAQSWPVGDSGAPPQVISHRPPQAVRPQLPARVISVPRNIVYNQAVPAGVTPYQPIVLETTTGDDDEMPGETLQVPLNELMRFAACPTPTRKEWSGKAERYSVCARFYQSHGMLGPGKGNGFAWPPEYPIESRKAWLLQYEAQALASAAGTALPAI